jgi:hypothetical protein
MLPIRLQQPRQPTKRQLKTNVGDGTDAESDADKAAASSTAVLSVASSFAGRLGRHANGNRWPRNCPALAPCHFLDAFKRAVALG